MCSVNSNCTRIDAVKATANQLKLQKLPPATDPHADPQKSQAVKTDLQALDSSIKTGDAQKAELALSNVRNALSQLDAAAGSDKPRQLSVDSGNFRQFLAYA